MLWATYQIDQNESIVEYQKSWSYLRGMVPLYVFLRHNPDIHLHDHIWNWAYLWTPSLIREGLYNECVQTSPTITQIEELCYMSWLPTDFLQPDRVYQPWNQKWMPLWSSFSKFHQWMPPWIICLPCEIFNLEKYFCSDRFISPTYYFL